MIGLFCAKYTTLDLKKCRGVIFDDTESHAKFEEKLICGLEKMTWGIWQIFIRTLESVKIGNFMGSFNRK